MAQKKREFIKKTLSLFKDQYEDFEAISIETGEPIASLARKGNDMFIALPENQAILKKHKKA